MNVHIDEITQPSGDTKLWRYMDLSKFLALLHTSSLFFAHVAALDDPFEGTLKNLVPDPDNFSDPSFFEEAYSRIRSHPKGIRARSAVSCWHMCEIESDAMWKLYSALNQGIAVQSTVEKLSSSIGSPTETDAFKIFRGCVSYDLLASPLSFTEMKAPHTTLFRKRPEFAHEQEYRLLLYASEEILQQITVNKGISIEVDLTILIESIYIAPITPPWIVALIQSLVSQTYKIDAEVRQSKLYSPPSW